MTDRRFALAEHLLATKPWPLFAMVEMGPDRMHHGFWKYMDPEHRKHEPGNPYESAILDYHRHVDGLIGRLLEHADEDTVVLVVSDHGAKRTGRRDPRQRVAPARGPAGTLAEPDRRRRSLRDVGIDWSRTVAWGEGGYYSRIFLNVEGREPEGIDGARGLRGASATTSRAGSRRSPTSMAARSDRGSTRRGGLPRGRTASRPTSSSTSAISPGARSGRSAATRASTPSRTTRDPTTRTTPRTGCSCSPALGSTRRCDGRAPARHRADGARQLLGRERAAHHAGHEPPGPAGSR